MVSAKPPSARMVSQRNSSSLSTPSGWLCRLVSGERTKRFLSVAPELKRERIEE